MQVEDMTVEQLCADLIRAKQHEADAEECRVAIERMLIEKVGGAPEEGVQTTEADGFKVKVEQTIKRTIDGKKYALIVDQIPEAVRPVRIEEVIKVDTKGVRWLKENEPGYYKLLCQAMTEKPAKPSVKVEITE
jgi:hypothetical protein